MNHIVWFRCQETRKNIFFKFWRRKSFYKFIYPPILIIIYLVFIFQFAGQHSLIYRSVHFERNKDNLFTYKLGNENLDIYIHENNSKTDLVYLHGAIIKDEPHKIISEKLMGMGYNVITPFYRGFGSSYGQPNEIGIMFDMKLLANLLQKRGNRIILFGQSLGCAVAVYLSQLISCDKIVLENPFYNLNTVIKAKTFRKYFSVFVTESWETNKRIERMAQKSNIQEKILFFISENDNLVNNKNSHMLNAHCNARVVLLEKSTHFNAFKNKKLYEEMKNFCN